jgi:DNA (cytosine-5)-methyltransferase 1
MVSALGDYYYDFPTPKPLKLRLKNMLEAEVDEKYYLSDVTIERIKNWNAQQDPLKNIDKEKIVSPCITARGAGEEHSGMILIKCEQVGEIQGNGYHEMSRRVYGSNGLSPTVRTFCGCGQEIKIAEDEPRFYDYYNKLEISGEYCGTITSCSAHNGSGTFFVQRNRDYRIRKLTPKECFRLMGVKDEDFDRVAKNQSKSSLYHCAGDSIVTTCLMAIFGEMLDVDWHSKIQLLYEG